MRLDVNGEIAVDTWWVADTIHVVGDVTVLDGVTLWIDPGVQVLFDTQTRLDVQGRLWAVGEPDAHIRFDSVDPAYFAPDSTLTGSWGGLRFNETSSLNDDSRLEWCDINHAKSTDENGGALSVRYFSKLAVVNCSFLSNVASNGGALYFAGGAAPLVSNCVIAKNYAFTAGAAVYCDYAYPRIELCTITENEILHDDAYWPTNIVHNYISKPQMTGNIIWDNSAPHFEGGQIWRGKPYYTRYCDVQDGYDGEGCIGDDPLFTFSADYAYSLHDGSPCIDAGPPAEMLTSVPELDAAGEARLYNSALDIGAYEWRPTPVDGEDTPQLTTGLRLYPNPFNPALACSFSLHEPSAVRIEVFNVRGQRVRILADESMSAGEHTFVWDGRDDSGRHASSGVYLVRLRANSQSTIRRAVLLK